jgi:putative ABC transport system permease protein
MTYNIPWLALLWCLVPLLLVLMITIRWQSKPKDVLVASARMLVQLLTVGYLLTLLFTQPVWWITLSILAFMLLVATWIALRPVREHKGLLSPALLALGIPVIFHLFISIELVLDVSPWYEPRIVIPLAGMFFANTMNSISLATERYFSEYEHNKDALRARSKGFSAAMIPQINALLAVGLVALPGMMTGQILSGVSPLIAIRYQILIMCMLLGTTGLGAALMLWQLARTNRSV